MNKDFDRQFSLTNFPFKTVLDADSIEALEIEFNNAPLKADIHKYSLQYWQESDFKPGRVEEMRTKDGRTLSDTDEEYYKLLGKNKLPKKYYTHDITKTNMVEKLTSIGGVFSGMQDYVLQPIAIDPVSLKTEAENAAKSILNIVSQIEYKPLQKTLMDSLVTNDENIGLETEKTTQILMNGKYEDAGRTDNYKRLKLYFNNFIIENYRVQTKDLAQIEKHLTKIDQAISDLNIVPELTDRQISGFIDGCIFANTLPDIGKTELLKAMYKKIGKPIPENLRFRSDQTAYTDFFKITKKYYGVK